MGNNEESPVIARFLPKQSVDNYEQRRVVNKVKRQVGEEMESEK
jgi:hypothetical protein